MKGWTEQPGVITRGGNPLWRCDADLCGAQVLVSPGSDRRAQHDRDFHLVRLESSGGGQEGYDLFLDCALIGDVRIKRETWNLIRFIVSETWVAWIKVDGVRTDVGGHERLRDTMQDVLRATGAKAWGKGKNPKVWHYPEEVR